MSSRPHPVPQAADPGRFGDALVVVGGSLLTDCATPTSDLDLLVVGSPDEARAAAAALESPSAVDLEVRAPEWLPLLAERLHGFTPCAAGGPSPFDFFDLRFLARVLLGEVIAGSPPETLREPLRVALTDYFATWWSSTYLDVLGLYLAERPDEALVLVGELAQRACMVALLQERLVDPAPKWALRRCARHDGLASSARLLQRALCCTEPDSSWLRGVLLACNRVVAASRAAQAANLVGDHAPPPVEWCVLGRPDLNLLLDGSDGRLMIYNDAVLASYLA
ncbi:nucleotidyltransferase domain-containing protein [Spirillospora sp. NPDC050679]